MAQSDINVALHQAKILFVRKSQFYVLAAVTLHIFTLMAIFWYLKTPQWAIAITLFNLLIVSLITFGIGAKFNLNFGLVSAIFLLSVFPFSLIALVPLKQFQQDREYIDYKRRIALLPILKQSSVLNLNLSGRIPMVSMAAVVIGSFIMMTGLWRFDNISIGMLGLILFSIGLITFNRTNISIRGEKIIITRTGVGGSLRRSNFSVVHRIEVTHIDYKHGRLKIRYQFVGTGVERDVVFFGSEKVCRRIVDALTTQSEENVYDVESMALNDDVDPFAPVDDFAIKDDNTVNLHSSTGTRTLISAIRSQQIGLIRQLLQAGVDPNGLDQSGQTPLQAAQHTGNLQIVELLQTSGAIS